MCIEPQVAFHAARPLMAAAATARRNAAKSQLDTTTKPHADQMVVNRVGGMQTVKL